MRPKVSERAFEEAIEYALLRYGPDACPGDVTTVQESLSVYGDDAVPGGYHTPTVYGTEPVPGGYHKCRADDYECALCLIPTDIGDFLLATQLAVAADECPRASADIKVGRWTSRPHLQ